MFQPPPPPPLVVAVTGKLLFAAPFPGSTGLPARSVRISGRALWTGGVSLQSRWGPFTTNRPAGLGELGLRLRSLCRARGNFFCWF